ncbi:MAG: hypothetical protein DHS20C10_08240 [marine bacterium B5-7]|nr:MAG: hypothetical protein DHS20C10_08240 [marine bacterium B5-7]
MPNVSFTTALAIGTQSQSGTSGDLGLFARFWEKPNYHAQLSAVSAIYEEDAKKFLNLLTKKNASPCYLSSDNTTSAWEIAVTDSTAYVTVLAYIALSRDGASLPVDFDFKLERRALESQRCEYIYRQENRQAQDTALANLPKLSPEGVVKTYVEHGHYWLDLTKAVIADATYKANHFVLDTHIAAYFLHQAVRFYQHALYSDQEGKLPSLTDKAAWAEPLGAFLGTKISIYLRGQFDKGWLQDYMACLEELAPRDIEFRLDKLLEQEKILFAQRRSQIKRLPEALTTRESDDDSQHTDDEVAPADTSSLRKLKKH